MRICADRPRVCLTTSLIVVSFPVRSLDVGSQTIFVFHVPGRPCYYPLPLESPDSCPSSRLVSRNILVNQTSATSINFEILKFKSRIHILYVDIRMHNRLVVVPPCPPNRLISFHAPSLTNAWRMSGIHEQLMTRAIVIVGLCCLSHEHRPSASLSRRTTSTHDYLSSVSSTTRTMGTIYYARPLARNRTQIWQT